MFDFNNTVGDIRNYDLGEGIICLGEGSGGKGGVGERGREVGVRGREVGNAYPLSTPSRRASIIEHSLPMTPNGRANKRDKPKTDKPQTKQIEKQSAPHPQQGDHNVK